MSKAPSTLSFEPGDEVRSLSSREGTLFPESDIDRIELNALHGSSSKHNMTQKNVDEGGVDSSSSSRGNNNNNNDNNNNNTSNHDDNGSSNYDDNNNSDNDNNDNNNNSNNDPNATNDVPDLDALEHASTTTSKAGGTLGPRPVCFQSTLQEVSFVLQATVATATNSFFSGACTIVTASIGRDLGMTQGEITWITASVALTAGSFQLGLGQLADLLGRRVTFMVGMASFSAFVLLVAFAQNPFWMDIVCGLLGICTAMVVPPAIGIMGAAYDRPSRRKNLAFSAFSAGNPLGFVLGSITCGIATMLFNWRAAFIFLAIVWAVFSVLAFFTVPKVEAYDLNEPFRSRLQRFLKQFDALGTFLTIFGTGLVTAGITLGPYDGWRSAHIIVMLILGVLLLLAFTYWETKYPYPLMPPHIWKDRNFTFILLTAVPGFMSFISAQFWLSLFMQEIWGLSALMVAVHLLPQVIAGLIWNIIAGNVLHRVNNTALLALGVGSYIASNVLLSIMRADSSYWAFIFPALILAVVGADFEFNVANMYVMQSLPSHQQGLAGGIFNMLFRLGTAVGLGLTTAVYSSVQATPQGLADPMLPFTRAFEVSIALSGLSLLFLPFVRVGTQGGKASKTTTTKPLQGSGGDAKAAEAGGGGDIGVAVGVALPTAAGTVLPAMEVGDATTSGVATEEGVVPRLE